MKLYKSLKIYLIMVSAAIAGIAIYFHFALAAQKTAVSTKSSEQLISVQQNIRQQIPVKIEIPSINLNAVVVKTGLEANGALHVPSNSSLTGWYDLGPKPGQVGPAVITGHLDTAAGPGVFWNLHNVKIDDEINIVRDDGTIAVFKVQKMQIYPQNNFDTQAVYGSIPNAGLRIITCAGTYLKSAGHYSDDLVVYASLVAIR